MTPPAKSIVRENAEKDPSYRPYCLRCTLSGRMRKIGRFIWNCPCGAVHDERTAEERRLPHFLYGRIYRDAADR